MPDEHGFADRTVPPEAVHAARAIAGTDHTAVWRALPGGALEVVQPGNPHSLYRVHRDGTTQLVAASGRQWDRILVGPAFGGVFVGMIGWWSTSGRAAAPVFVALLVCAVLGFVSCLVFGQKPIAWAMEVAPDESWARVPREGTVEGATGNQLVAAARIADSGTVSARRLDDGTVEVVKGGALHRVSRTGEVVEHEVHAPYKPWRSRVAIAAAVTGLVAAIPLERWPARVSLAAGVGLVITAIVFAAREYSLTDEGEWATIRTDDPSD